VREGREADFQQFEEIVLPRLSQYSGELVLRLRPDRASKIAGSGDLPYEVHVVRFETEEGLARYSNDEERQRSAGDVNAGGRKTEGQPERFRRISCGADQVVATSSQTRRPLHQQNDRARDHPKYAVSHPVSFRQSPSI
jgi:hypothetical protein